MLCDCIEDLEKRMIEKGYLESRVMNIGHVIIDNTFVSKLNIPVEYRENKKDGTPKKNKSTISVMSSFCPFCGKSTKTEQESEK